MTAHALQEPYIPLMERVHQGTVKRFNSEAEMKASYSASRKRCFGGEKIVNQIKNVLEKQEKTRDFNCHVVAYRRYLIMKKLNLCGEVKEAYRSLNIKDMRPTGKDIIIRVADKHKIAAADIVGPRRNKFIVAARFEAIAEVTESRPDLSLPQIGRIFNRDHTTILYALKRAGVIRENHYQRNIKAS